MLQWKASLRSAKESFPQIQGIFSHVYLSGPLGAVEDSNEICTVRQLHKAVQATYLTHQAGMPDIIFNLLQGCAKSKDLSVCRQVHALMITSAFALSSNLFDYLIRLFSLCGSLLEANLVFLNVEKPSIYTWHAIISAHAMLGESHRALYLYHQMQVNGIQPSKFMFLGILKVCSSIGVLEQARLIHSQIMESGMISDVIIGSSLVDVYAKCGNLEDAQKVFDEMPNQNVVSWGALLNGYALHGRGIHALKFYEKMKQKEIIPDKFVFSCMLKACGSIRAIGQGRLIHDQIINSSLEENVVLGNSLIDMYAKSGSLQDAHKVFDNLPNPSSVSWGAIMAGYANEKHSFSTLELFGRMQQEGIKPSKFTFSSSLKTCANIVALGHGRLIHDQIIRSGLESDVVIGNTLIDMYGKCGSLEEAHRVFQALPNQDETSWGAMIAGCAQHEQSLTALKFFETMQQEDMKPNEFIFSCALQACGNIGAKDEGRLIHNMIVKSGLESDAIVGSTLVDMHAKCWSLEEACKTFNKLPQKNVASWGAMIAGYTQQGHGQRALELFWQMKDEGIKPNVVLLSSVLTACANEGTLEQGRVIHSQIINSEVELDVVLGNTLIDMYTKCGCMEAAWKVFNEMPSRDVVTWNSMIAGYAQNGRGLSVLELLGKMQHDGIQPDRATFLCPLKTCANTGAIGQGRLMHEQIISSGIEKDMLIGNALIDMYARCASLEDAHKVFAGMQSLDVVSWGAMITGYAQHGNCKMIGQCLTDMQQQGMMPDGRIFTSILAACRHAGHVEEGRRYFKSIKEDYGIIPSLEQFNCMIDLLARTGHFNDAQEFLETMPILPDITGWTSLLTGCRIYGNVELGKKCFDQVVRLDPTCAAGYVLMSNIYADAQQWDNVNKIKAQRKFISAQKKPGKASVEVNNTTDEFIVGDDAHLHSVDMHAKLSRLRKLMEDDGHVLTLDLILEPT